MNLDKELDVYTERDERMERLLGLVNIFSTPSGIREECLERAMKYSTLWAVANDVEDVKLADGFISVDHYGAGRAMPGEIGTVENTRFLAAFDPKLCKRAHSPSRRGFIWALAKHGQFWTEL